MLSELAGENCSPDPVITGITADSRDVEPGFLFAAIPGEQTDGAAFIPQAEERGAAAVLAPPGVASSLPIIVDDAPRLRLSQMAARFYPSQPGMIAGVTGTNGKTSVARFVAQLWATLGENSGSLGTLGAEAENFKRPLTHTTPEPVTLHRTLHDMAEAGVTHLGMEVSSHGLAQHRADNVRVSIAAFTNITQDHLDYHDDFEAYFEAKARLIEVLDKDGVVVVNCDGAGAQEFIEVAKKRKLRILTTGVAGATLALKSVSPLPNGIAMTVVHESDEWRLTLPLIGAFQAENALLAAGVVMASGVEADRVVPLLENLAGAPGRMEHVADVAGLAPIYVDYAHTPDAVATALQALRPHVRGRLIAIIGAGGDRDAQKRPLMGRAAAAHADLVIVTDDNPRTEDPAAIRCAVMEGAPEASEIGDRKAAIAEATAMLKENDALLIAGKGHETGQDIGGKVLPFNDADEAKAAALARSKELGR